jgi:hypothetical protein
VTPRASAIAFAKGEPLCVRFVTFISPQGASTNTDCAERNVSAYFKRYRKSFLVVNSFLTACPIIRLRRPA